MVVAAVNQRYHHFHIVPTHTAHGSSPDVQERWRSLLGERVLLLDDEAAVCETIALTIGLNEGALDDLERGVDDLRMAGYDDGAAQAAVTAMTRSTLGGRRNGGTGSF